MWKAAVSFWITCYDGKITSWLFSVAVILKDGQAVSGDLD